MRVERLDASAYRIPTESPEADGTLAWDSTTLVLAEAVAESGARGIGFSYAAAAACEVMIEQLAPVVVDRPIEGLRDTWSQMLRAVRNIGRPGVAACAISAVDVALWDLWARATELPLFRLLGAYREEVPIYASGGFTSYDDGALAEQLGGWVEQGIPRVKMKVGADGGKRPDEDVRRVRLAREAIGPHAELFVDANGAYTQPQAVAQAQRFAADGVSYFEEPVPSDHLAQLAEVRERVPAGVAIAAGEYAYDPWTFRNMLEARGVDILQADVTRCLGITGWLMAAQLAYAFDVPLSAHTAPSIHAHVGCAAPDLAHVEYFHDHVRIERLLFDGTPQRVGGCLRPDPKRAGLGMELKEAEAERWRTVERRNA